VAEKPESQEICFVEGDYRAYLRRRAGESIRPGVIRDTKGAIRGQHSGVPYFTVGQRHGLGIGNSTPLYVIALDAARNEVLVGEEGELLSQEVEVGRVNPIAVEAFPESRPVLVMLRSTQAAVKARLVPLGGDRVRLRFEEPQRAVAPGQAAVFYDVDDPEVVLGGGTILGRVPEAAGAPPMGAPEPRRDKMEPTVS
jgi:tRNA-specific 2-thiouridylase